MLCNFDMLCNFVLTLYKKLTFYKDLNKKAICKSSTVLSWTCKNMLSEIFEFFKKENKFYKEKCGKVKKLKSVKNVIIKRVSYESFSTIV